MSARTSAAMYRALRLYAAGAKIAQAARAAGVHRRSLERALKRLGRPTRVGEQADTLRGGASS